MTNWTRRHIDPVDHMRQRGWPCEHIRYDPQLRRGEYSINRETTHDGTLFFELELLANVLLPLVNKQSFYKPREAEFDRAAHVHYTVGPLKLATVYGQVDLPCGRFPGECQRARIPVVMHTFGWYEVWCFCGSPGPSMFINVRG